MRRFFDALASNPKAVEKDILYDFFQLDTLQIERSQSAAMQRTSSIDNIIFSGSPSSRRSVGMGHHRQLSSYDEIPFAEVILSRPLFIRLISFWTFNDLLSLSEVNLLLNIEEFSVLFQAL